MFVNSYMSSLKNLPYTLRPQAEGCIEYNPGQIPVNAWLDLNNEFFSFDIQFLKLYWFFFQFSKFDTKNQKLQNHLKLC